MTVIPDPPSTGRLYHSLSWDEVRRDALELARRLKSLHEGPFLGLVCVSRGGLIPAGLVSRALDIRRVECVSVAVYDGPEAGPARVLKPPGAMVGDGTGWLVVDDLVDRGHTARLMRALLPGACYATLYAKPEGAKLADLWVRAFEQDVWLVFPWDDTPLGDLSSGRQVPQS